MHLFTIIQFLIKDFLHFEYTLFHATFHCVIPKVITFQHICCTLKSVFNLLHVQYLDKHRYAEREDAGSNPGQTNTQGL